VPHQKKYIAFFDLDKTILRVNSGTLLVRQAYKNKIMGIGDILNAIIQGYLYKFNLRETNLIISKMGTWLKGIRQESIDELCSEVVDLYLINNIRPEIKDEIAFHRENNAGIIILSSAITSICIPIGRNLGVDDIICTTMENELGTLTGKPVGNYCFEDEKRIRLLSYCTENNYDPSTAWYYADSISDFSALASVGNPVCVCPDKKLTRIALEKGWHIIHGISS
jgi:HAD superfamily hydrolase (TIGR01490 family)